MSQNINVNDWVAVEMEDSESGHRFWRTMPKDEVNDYIQSRKELGYYLSDLDTPTESAVEEAIAYRRYFLNR